jgi:hypothetical protein
MVAPNQIIFSVFFSLALLMVIQDADAQDANYDEAKVPIYELPNPLLSTDGTKVDSEQSWAKRRVEILQLFKDHVYGALPDTLLKDIRIKSDTIKEVQIELAVGSETGETVTAKLREVKLSLVSDNQPDNQVDLNLLMFLPLNHSNTTPAFLGYNFQGNHTVNASAHITLPTVWNKDRQSVLGTEEHRGSQAGRWPVGLIVSKGFGLVTAYYGDIDPDFDDQFQNGVHGFYPKLQNRPDNWSSIGAWSWGLQRVMDFLESEALIDTSRVALLGHSRLGKTSLWAGATDDRFAIVISNNSGCGGAALARRQYGETVGRINKVFPHWFCEKHKSYNDNENAMPVDQHMLISLIAPRPVYIASAQEDRWADPTGEFLSAFHASPVYEVLGKKGLDIEQPDMPEIEHPIGESVGYHIRSGKHDVTRYDWEQFLKFARRHFE